VVGWKPHWLPTIPVKKSVCKHRFPTKTQHIANKNDNVLQNYKIN